MAGLPSAPIQSLEQQANGEGTKLAARLVDRGEIDVAQGGKRAVVVADERDILGHSQSSLSQGVKRPHGDQVVRREDGGRRTATSQQCAALQEGGEHRQS